MKSIDKHRYAYVTIAIILLNVICFLLLEYGGSTEDNWFMLEKGALYGPLVVERGEYYRLISSVFMHSGMWHIISNMVILFVVGGYLEREFGRKNYLFLYLVCGVTSNTISILLSQHDYNDTISMGASGAIFGVIGALLYVLIVNHGRLRNLYIEQLGMLVIVSLYFGLTNAGVDNVAHISGLIIGFIVGVILYPAPVRNERKTIETDG